MATADPFDFVRRHCLAIYGVTEKLSHGSPSFFARGTPSRSGPCFVTCMDDHHGDSILGLWIAASPGAQQACVSRDPDTYFVPPYVGHRGWLGVRLDRSLPREELVDLLDEAHAAVRK
jgi:predicted DNA-binding protein (MmcQ/YjbR family)